MCTGDKWFQRYVIQSNKRIGVNMEDNENKLEKNEVELLSQNMETEDYEGGQLVIESSFISC